MIVNKSKVKTDSVSYFGGNKEKGRTVLIFGLLPPLFQAVKSSCVCKHAFHRKTKTKVRSSLVDIFISDPY